MADESERSREAGPPESEERFEPVEVKPEVRPAEGEVVKVEGQGEGQEEEGKQTKRAILGEYLYLTLPSFFTFLFPTSFYVSLTSHFPISHFPSPQKDPRNYQAKQANTTVSLPTPKDKKDGPKEKSSQMNSS